MISEENGKKHMKGKQKQRKKQRANENKQGKASKLRGDKAPRNPMI
jgi:hypothetical protein